MAKAAAQDSKVLLENDRVRVVELTLKPGQKMKMHTHPNYFTYSMDTLHYRSTSPDGKTQKRSQKAGAVSWYDGESHAVEVVGKGGRIIVVELK